MWTFGGAVDVRWVDLPSPEWVWVKESADLARVTDGAVVRARGDLAVPAKNRGAILLGP
ncbi:MAG: hypothetical protein H0V89_13655 [Deltaproteobacteria bacterium]|nr:hypothetical protein [Deltaproteobacteria bacterium]